MARGIHLKQLRNADLEAIGVPEDGLPELPEGEGGRPVTLLSEVDPVLAGTVDEVRQGLEATLGFLNEALSAVNRDPTSSEIPSNPNA